LHDIFMNTTTTSTDIPRRSSRVFMRIYVLVKGKNAQGQNFSEPCQTVAVNAHGGLIYLQEHVEMDASLVLASPLSEEEQECRVVYVGDSSERGTRVGVEFLSPAPHFWGVEFTRPDWPTCPIPPRLQ